MKTVALSAVLAACGPPTTEPVVVGARPPECDPAPGVDLHGEDFTAPPPPLTVIYAGLPTTDPDCTPATVSSTPSVSLAWRDHDGDHTSSLPASVLTTRESIAGACRVRFRIRLGGGPVGRAGAVQACDAQLLSDTWATMSQVPVALDAITLDGIATSLAGPLVWRGTVPTTSCTAPRIERAALGIQIDTELRLELPHWRRLHSPIPPLLAIRLAIEAS